MPTTESVQVAKGSLERNETITPCPLKRAVFVSYYCGTWTLLRIPNKICFAVFADGKFGTILLLETADLNSPARKIAVRGGTRIPCEIPITLTSPDPFEAFSQPCKIILANLRGCAARSPSPVPPGTVVHLNGLPAKTGIPARVVNCISLGEFENLWLLGLALYESGNVWGLARVPEDWQQQT
jgi:hypothetical protein